MKCVICEKAFPGITFENDVNLCFACIRDIKRLEIFAPNPFQEVE